MRSFKALAATAVVVALALPGGVQAKSWWEWWRPTPEPTPAQICYAAGPLVGHRASDLYADYLGTSGRNDVIGPKICTNFKYRLAALWQAKSKMHRRNPVVDESAHKLVDEYGSKDPGRMSLAQYESIANQRARILCANLNWRKLGERFRLSPDRQNLVQNLSCEIDGRALIAYSMTELLPGRYDGQFNKDYMDFLLRNGGRRFVESIPAIHDGVTSFGSFQFTSFAVYDVGGRQNGASRVNPTLPNDLRIPGSVMELRGDDHIDAAYLFAVANLADLVKSLNVRELAVWKREWRSTKLDLVEYVATAHNKPAFARKSARRWLDHGARLPYDVSTTRVGSIYAHKTQVNYLALRGQRPEERTMVMPAHQHVRASRHERHRMRLARHLKHHHQQPGRRHHRR